MGDSVITYRLPVLGKPDLEHCNTDCDSPILVPLFSIILFPSHQQCIMPTLCLLSARLCYLAPTAVLTFVSTAAADPPLWLYAPRCFSPGWDRAAATPPHSAAASDLPAAYSGKLRRIQWDSEMACAAGCYTLPLNAGPSLQGPILPSDVLLFSLFTSRFSAKRMV